MEAALHHMLARARTRHAATGKAEVFAGDQWKAVALFTLLNESITASLRGVDGLIIGAVGVVGVVRVVRIVGTRRVVGTRQVVGVRVVVARSVVGIVLSNGQVIRPGLVISLIILRIVRAGRIGRLLDDLIAATESKNHQKQ